VLKNYTYKKTSRKRYQQYGRQQKQKKKLIPDIVGLQTSQKRGSADELAGERLNNS
jgi:hypothetical protein